MGRPLKPGDIVIAKSHSYDTYKGRPYKVKCRDDLGRVSLSGSDYWHPGSLFKLVGVVDERALLWLKMLRDGESIRNSKQWNEIKSLIEEIEGNGTIQGT